MNTYSDTTVVIAGAGPTGLTAAIILATNGVAFRIVDKKAGPVDETRALVVHAKTLELWQKLGLARQAVRDGRRMGAVQVLRMGKPVGALSFMETDAEERTPFPFALSYTQNQSERMMVEHLQGMGIEIEWNTAVLDVTQTASAAHVRIQRQDGTTETIAARWVVGADGAKSAVRHAIHQELKGDTYEQTSFLADVELNWAFGQDRVVIDLTEHGFTGYFPVPGEHRFRIVGTLTPELARKNTLTLDDIQQLLDQTSTLNLTLRDPRWISIYRLHHRMSERFRIGRVFLVGDAAHIHSPAGGQGMNTGIGDAFNLAWKLALVAHDMAYETLLDSYEPERMPFARAIINGSDQGFTAAVTQNPIGRRLKLEVLPRLFRIVSSLGPIRRRAFWFVSQLWTTYRGSPAVDDSRAKRGQPQPGDRAPYGICEDGTPLFDTLTGTQHHLLLFEGTNPAFRTRPTQDAVDAVLKGYAAPVSVHIIGAKHRQLYRCYGVTTSMMFLVRPDGHIAWGGDDLRGLQRYLDRSFISKPDEDAQPYTPKEVIATSVT